MKVKNEHHGGIKNAYMFDNLIEMKELLTEVFELQEQRLKPAHWYDRPLSENSSLLKTSSCGEGDKDAMRNVMKCLKHFVITCTERTYMMWLV